jgi:endo-1,4-beta-D-glucanase Y
MFPEPICPLEPVDRGPRWILAPMSARLPAPIAALFVLGSVACDVGETSGSRASGGASAAGGSAGAGGSSGGSSGSGGSGGPPPPPSCECGQAAVPFGSHAVAPASDAILPSGGQPALDDATRAAYDDWKAAYLRKGCGGWYVESSNGSMTVSEAHGYGMLIEVMIAGHDPGAKAQFDGMVRFYEDHPSTGQPPLMAWSQDSSCQSDRGGSSASDGDLDIAYALLLADKQWGSCEGIDYKAKALALLDAIRQHELDATGSYVLLGDWVSPDGEHYDATRSSDFMPGHFAAFAEAQPGGGWALPLGAGYSMIEALQDAHSPATGLLPDFIRDPLGSPAPAEPNFLERDVDGAYSFNACRDPWRLGSHFLTTGDERARAAANRIEDFVRESTGGDAWNVKGGYWLDGSPIADYLSLAFVAPLGVGAMLDPTRQSWLDALWDVTRQQSDEGYYADTLRLLGMIAMSGNWWAPEQVGCEK